MKHVVFLFCFLGLLGKAQIQTTIAGIAKGKMYSQLFTCKNDKDRKKMQKLKLAIANHSEPAIDQLLHYWAETYHKGNYVFMSPKEVDAADGKKYTTVKVNTAEYDNNFTYKHYETKLVIWSAYGSFDLNFDAVQTFKSGEQLGVDRTGADIANKLLQYLLVYEYEINAEGRQYRMGQNILMGSPVATILSKTVLVPTEYLSLGLQKEDFGTKYKYDFVPAEKIAQRVKKQRAAEGLCANVYYQNK